MGILQRQDAKGNFLLKKIAWHKNDIIYILKWKIDIDSNWTLKIYPHLNYYVN